MESKLTTFIIITLIIGLKVSFIYLDEAQQAAKKVKLAALIEADSGGQPFHGDPRSKEVSCQTHGGLPDHNCTPGAIFSEASLDQICVHGYTATVRSVSSSLKKQVYAEYGLSYPQPTGAYEADHLIPLELGGSNDIANLFPEAAQPTPGFHEKDLVENYLNQEVCAKHISLAAAQQQIATNWLTVYNSLTPDQINTLIQQVKSFRSHY